MFWLAVLFCFGSVCYFVLVALVQFAFVLFPLFLFHCLTIGLLGYITAVWFGFAQVLYLVIIIAIKETVSIFIVSASLVLEPVSLLFL